MASRKKKPARKTAPIGKARARKKSSIDGTRLMILLERHALGEVEMTTSQVSVALALLKIAQPAADQNSGSHEDALSALA